MYYDLVKQKKNKQKHAHTILCFQQSNISAMKTAMLAKMPDTQLAEIWLKLVSQLIDDMER